MDLHRRKKIQLKASPALLIPFPFLLLHRFPIFTSVLCISSPPARCGTMVVPWDPALPEDQTQEYFEAVTSFLDSNTTTKEAIQDGLRYHRAQPLITKPNMAKDPESLEDEVRERLVLAKRAFEYFRNAKPGIDLSKEACDRVRDGSFRYNMLHIAFFMEIPLEVLRGFFKSKLKEKQCGKLFDALKANENFLALCTSLFLTPSLPPSLPPLLLL